MDKDFIGPAAALRKLRAARGMPQTVYLYGATGYGKTELVHQFLAGQSVIWLSCGELPWKGKDVLPPEPGAGPAGEAGAARPPRRVVVIDDLHRLKSEEIRQQIAGWAQRRDLWLILISRSPIPAWLMPSYIKDGFVVVAEEDLRLGRAEIGGYLKNCGINCTEEEIQQLEKTSEGNAYAIRHGGGFRRNGPDHPAVTGGRPFGEPDRPKAGDEALYHKLPHQGELPQAQRHPQGGRPAGGAGFGDTIDRFLHQEDILP